MSTNAARAGNGQMDDNIDDMGRKPDGTTLDQPGTGGADAARHEGDTEQSQDKGDVAPGSDADADPEKIGKKATR